MDLTVKTFLSADGAEIKYVDEGSGTPILYFYGMGSSLASQEKLINLMRKYCRFIVFDQRGYGLTEKAGEIGIHQSARDGKALLAHLGIEKAILMGYSMGAADLFSYVKQFGCDNVEKVIIGDMSPKLINEDGWNLGLYQGHYTRKMYEEDLEMIKTEYKRFALILTEQLLYKNTPEGVYDFSGTEEEIRNRIMSGGQQQFIIDTLLAGLVDVPESHQEANYDYWVTMAGADFREVIKTISVPAAIIYADPGSGYCPGTAEYMHSVIPNSELMPMKGCSHMAPSENMRQYMTYLSRFCDFK